VEVGRDGAGQTLSVQLERVRARDARNDDSLRAAGWTVLRVWEHEPPDQAARRVADLITRLRGQQLGTVHFDSGSTGGS
jgi:very-short-patch-repair endonuclease